MGLHGPGRALPARAAGAQPADHHDRALHRLPDLAVQRGGVRAHRDRAQRRHRAGGPARPRLRRLLRHRRVHRGAAVQPGLRAGRALPVAGHRADRDGGHDDLRGHPRDADAAAARRLPGDRHARLRRDRPAARRQRRPAARQPRLPGHRAPRGRLPRRHPDLLADRRPRLLLARGHDHRDRPAVHGEPRALAGGARVDRRARGRGRRGALRRPDLPVQDLGLRDRRGGRWSVGHAVRRPGRLRQQPALRHHDVDAVPRRGGARRAGQQGRRDPRGVPRLVHPRPLPVRADLPVPDLRRRPHRPDDLPPAGSARDAPAPAGQRQTGVPEVVRGGDGRGTERVDGVEQGAGRPARRRCRDDHAGTSPRGGGE